MRTTLVCLSLAVIFAAPSASAQAPRDDSLRTELIRSRGFIRAAETQLSKVLAILDAAPVDSGPPVVLDWRTGEWGVFAAGYRGTLDLSAGTATHAGVTAPALLEFSGDTLRARLAVPGWEGAGLLELVHAEGRMIGTIQRDTITRQAAAQRPTLAVVRTAAQDGCTFAEYTDGSWGVAPMTGPCHVALNDFVGGMRFVARVYTP